MFHETSEQQQKKFNLSKKICYLLTEKISFFVCLFVLRVFVVLRVFGEKVDKKKNIFLKIYDVLRPSELDKNIYSRHTLKF